MDLSKTKFCTLPFISRFQRLNGIDSLCCNSSTPIFFNDTEKMQKLRQTIYSGGKIPHCNFCYDLEDKGINSPRITQTTEHLQDPEIAEYIKNWNVGTKPITYDYDLRLSSKCNLACIMCSPPVSSLWAKELGIPVRSIPTKFDLAECADAKYIYLAGGEPLIIDECISLLELISKNNYQPNIVISTNLSSISDELLYTLSNLKNLTLIASIDAFGKVNDYHRWPLKWDRLLRNIELANQAKLNLQLHSVVDAISIFGVAELVQIENYFSAWLLNEVLKPSPLECRHLPEDTKELALKSFEKIKLSKYYTEGSIFTNMANMMIDELATDGSPELLSTFLKKIDDRRNMNHSDYVNVNLIR